MNPSENYIKLCQDKRVQERFKNIPETYCVTHKVYGVWANRPEFPDCNRECLYIAFPSLDGLWEWLMEIEKEEQVIIIVNRDEKNVHILYRYAVSRADSKGETIQEALLTYILEKLK